MENPKPVDNEPEVCHNENGERIPCPSLTELYSNPAYVQPQQELT